MNRNAAKKKYLSIGFLIGWITLGIMSSLDVSKYLDDNGETFHRTGVTLFYILWMLFEVWKENTRSLLRYGQSLYSLVFVPFTFQTIMTF